MRRFVPVILAGFLVFGTGCVSAKYITAKTGASTENDIYRLSNGDYCMSPDFMTRVTKLKIKNPGKVIVIESIKSDQPIPNQ